MDGTCPARAGRLGEEGVGGGEGVAAARLPASCCEATRPGLFSMGMSCGPVSYAVFHSPPLPLEKLPDSSVKI
ncbi:hypothetical protein NL676_026198 [Syzygium grande]|nr:hypothetical protein NL676_026198 [Syzygium grande]